MSDEPTRAGGPDETREDPGGLSETDPTVAAGPPGDGEPAPPGADATATLGDLDATRTRGAPGADAAPEVPAYIGKYRILRKLGEGGMGVVFEAEQQHPQRKVALKVVRGGRFVDEYQVKMFQREADTLARLKHSNIAAIYESGRTDDGQHFFAMELVRGLTLGDYLTSRPETISPRELETRLRLFVKMCDAVNYAHQRGVIHRDLKPANIFVTDAADGGGASVAGPVTREVKILDFGLARITDADMAAASMVTEVGVIKGTLRYMSPEQAKGNPDEIDVRTDVYALGVILYEMLTGEHPYDIGKTSLVDALRVICESPPGPLREAWSGSRRLDGDLETIVNKALEKAPEMRYETAAALSVDVGRYLISQPILARPPSTIYQLKKAVARNKLATAFAASVLALLVGFGVWMSVLYAQAEINLRRAVAAEGEAKREAETANEVSNFLTGLFEVSDPSEARGNQILARDILDKGATHIQEELADQPVLQARLMRTMGEVYRNLGIHEVALSLLQSSVALRKEHLGEDHPEVAEAQIKLGGLLYQMGQYDLAKPVLEEALAIQERHLDQDDLAIAATLNNLGAIAMRYDRDGLLCRRYWERALAIRERSLGPDHDDVARVLGNLAIIYGELKEYGLANESLARAIRIREGSQGSDDPKVALLYQKLATMRLHLGEYDAAIESGLRALRIQEEVLDPGHETTATTLNVIGEARLGRGEYREAGETLLRAVAVHTAARGENHYDTILCRENLVRALQGLGAHEDLIPLIQTQIEAVESGSGNTRNLLAPNLRAMAAALRAVGRDSEAVECEARAERLESLAQKS